MNIKAHERGQNPWNEFTVTLYLGMKGNSCQLSRRGSPSIRARERILARIYIPSRVHLLLAAGRGVREMKTLLSLLVRDLFGKAEKLLLIHFPVSLILLGDCYKSRKAQRILILVSLLFLFIKSMSLQFYLLMSFVFYLICLLFSRRLIPYQDIFKRG